MLQELSNVLRSLGLRNDADTVKAVNSVIPTVNQIDPFPFTGNALIDGTLNIDFTETLDFVTTDEFEFEAAQFLGLEFGQTILTGDFIGTKNQFDDDVVQSGSVDGILSIPLFEVFGDVSNAGHYLSVNSGGLSGSTITDITGIQDETNFGGAKRYLKEISAVRKDGDDYREYSIGINFTDGQENLTIAKINEAGEETGINLGDSGNAVNIFTNQSDEDAEIFNVVNLDELQFLLQVKNSGVFLPNLPTADPLTADQVWLDGDTLKISAGPL